jgi:hypothetical protein
MDEGKVSLQLGQNLEDFSIFQPIFFWLFPALCFMSSGFLRRFGFDLLDSHDQDFADVFSVFFSMKCGSAARSFMFFCQTNHFFQLGNMALFRLVP